MSSAPFPESTNRNRLYSPERCARGGFEPIWSECGLALTPPQNCCQHGQA
jgi:hypothetical protein